MEWKYEAIEKLKMYEARKASLESIPAEIHRLELEYANIRSATTDATPVQGGGGRREDQMLSNIVRREELARQLASAQAWVKMVDGGLACLDDEERLVLDRLYLHRQRGSFDRLMDELGLEKSQVYSRREKALRHFTIALYGGMES